jgi:hypothetical protein
MPKLVFSTVFRWLLTKLFKYFSASTSMNYEEIWYTKTIERSYDVDQSKVVDKTINGFDAFRTYSSLRVWEPLFTEHSTLVMIKK